MIAAFVVIIAAAMVIVAAAMVIVATAMVIVAAAMVIVAAAVVVMIMVVVVAVVATAAIVATAAVVATAIVSAAGAAIVTAAACPARRTVAIAARTLFVTTLTVGDADDRRRQGRTLIKLVRGEDLAPVQSNATALVIGTSQRTAFCDRHHRSNRRLGISRQIERRSRQRKYYEQSFSYGFPDCRHCLSPWDCAATTAI
ncbi:hypothetical protein SLT36_01030 [Aminobacter sp. BA135]|uniref:hypothetical protein n=1 Tax=Aminobacter sp. BA135 TaxID=537596 RepID=UPI003D7B6396